MAFIELQNKKANLKISRGDFVVVFGPSGSGKTTLLNLIGALDTSNRPAGKTRIIVNKQNIANLTDQKAARFRSKTIGFVFQSDNLIPTLTVIENVAFPMAFGGVGQRKAKKRAVEILGVVGIKEREKHRPSELTSEELQRVAIARALANNPQIILADEPTGNLDSKAGQSIMRLFKELNRQGKTIILATNNRAHSKYAKRVISLLDGKVTSDTKQQKRK